MSSTDTKIEMRLILDTQYSQAKAKIVKDILRQHFEDSGITPKSIKVTPGSIQALVELAVEYLPWLIAAASGGASYLARGFLQRFGKHVADRLSRAFRKADPAPRKPEGLGVLQISALYGDRFLGRLVERTSAQLGSIDQSLANYYPGHISRCVLKYNIRTPYVHFGAKAIREGTTHQASFTLTSLSQTDRVPVPVPRQLADPLGNEAITYLPALTSGADLVAVLRGSTANNFSFPSQEEREEGIEIKNLADALYKLNNFDGAQPMRLEKAEPQLEELLAAVRQAGWAAFGVRTRQVRPQANSKEMLSVANIAIVSHQIESVQLLSDGQFVATPKRSASGTR